MPMKTLLRHLLPGTLALSLVLSAASLHAGTVVVGDGHGGYGFAYGPHPREELERRATKHCLERSRFPDSVHVIFETPRRGSGVIVRFHYGEGRTGVAADAGGDEHDVYDAAMKDGRGHDGEQADVVERWTDE